MSDVLQNLPPAVTARASPCCSLVWLVLLLLVPFMIESIRNSTRKTYVELEEMNQKVDRLIALIEERRGAPTFDAPPPRDRATEPTGERARREPTI